MEIDGMKITRGLGAVAVLIMLITGCAAEDPGDLVGPDLAAEARSAASEAADGATSVDGQGVTLIASRSVDECGEDPTGTQPADYARTYRCGLGRVAL
jgi:hypothetical protein